MYEMLTTEYNDVLGCLSYKYSVLIIPDLFTWAICSAKCDSYAIDGREPNTGKHLVCGILEGFREKTN